MLKKALDETRGALAEAVSSNRFPAHLHHQIRALMGQIDAPVRLTIFGPTGSGKSTLINLLLGSEVLNPDHKLPTTQFKWGEAQHATCTMADGSTHTYPRFDTAEISSRAPIYIEVELPLPALGKISMMEVVVSGGAAEMAQALAWADKRTDIAIWCTQDFDETEQDGWLRARDDMKDHAFLVVTKADLLAAENQLENTLADLNRESADQFIQILPLATHEAIASRNSDGQIDTDKMTKSGGRALISAILSEVEQGRRALCDNAEVLLRQYPTATDAAEPSQTAAQNAPAEAANTVPKRTQRPTDKPVSKTKKWVDQPKLTGVDYADAVGRFSNCGQRFNDEISKTGSLDVRRLMQETANSVQWLCDHICENGDESDATLVQMRDSVFDAADLMQLMFMEEDGNAAADSIALVIQLKRDMEARLAA
ncbi:MAG: hypothetical protein WBC93_08535 [Sulfitobacter sp.]